MIFSMTPIYIRLGKRTFLAKRQEKCKKEILHFKKFYGLHRNDLAKGLTLGNSLIRKNFLERLNVAFLFGCKKNVFKWIKK